MAEFSGGPQRKIYHLAFKLIAIEYAYSVIEGGKGFGGAVNIRSATWALGIAEETTVEAWIRNPST